MSTRVSQSARTVLAFIPKGEPVTVRDAWNLIEQHRRVSRGWVFNALQELVAAQAVERIDTYPALYQRTS